MSVRTPAPNLYLSWGGVDAGEKASLPLQLQFPYLCREEVGQITPLAFSIKALCPAPYHSESVSFPLQPGFLIGNLFIFCLSLSAYRILFPQPGIKHGLTSVGALES